MLDILPLIARLKLVIKYIYKYSKTRIMIGQSKKLQQLSYFGIIFEKYFVIVCFIHLNKVKLLINVLDYFK